MENKNIVICLDGTGNDPEDAVQEVGKDGNIEDDNISNVLKLHLLMGGKLNNQQTNKTQQCFYYSGVGTSGTIFRRTLASMFANFEPKWIRKEAYEDLCENYKDGDNIFIFGFSRGAAIARMLASEISKKGIREHKPKIKFLGVWDTVASMGIPNLDDNTRPISDVVFEDGIISEAIENAVHLVAIDETRKAFRPVLMNASDRVEEVWFTGVHSDIGGGYRLDGLSDITLEFMIRRASKYGLNFIQVSDIDFSNLGGEKDEVIDESDVVIRPDIEADIHKHMRSEKISELTLAPRRVCTVIGNEPSNENLPIIHYSVLERHKKKPSYKPDNLLGIKHYVIDKNDTLSKYDGLESY